MKRSSWFFVFLLLLVACGKGVELPIPDANDVGRTNGFPGVVLIQSKSGTCTGVLVGPKAILTAAHCAKNEITISLGNGSPKIFKVEKLGPGTVGDKHDIALVVLESEVSDLVPYSIGRPIQSGQTVHLVGYGCGGKRAGTNRVSQIEDYIEVVTPNVSPQIKRLIGPSNRAGSCPGDSGGPMFVQNANGQYELVGIDHAVVSEGRDQISAYINITQGENRRFLEFKNRSYSLQISGF